MDVSDPTVSAHLGGGQGNDALTSVINVDSAFLVSADLDNSLDGGANNDDLTAFISIHTADSLTLAAGASFSAKNQLTGGSGDDSLYARISASFDDRVAAPSGVASNDLFGGAGNDVLTGEFAPGALGQSPIELHLYLTVGESATRGARSIRA